MSVVLSQCSRLFREKRFTTLVVDKTGITSENVFVRSVIRISRRRANGKSSQRAAASLANILKSNANFVDTITRFRCSVGVWVHDLPKRGSVISRAHFENDTQTFNDETNCRRRNRPVASVDRFVF